MVETRTFRLVTNNADRSVCTQILACQAPDKPQDGRKWVEDDAAITRNLTQLWIQGNVRYFGRL